MRSVPNKSMEWTLMERPFKFMEIRTTQFAWLALVVGIVGWALDAVTGPLWTHFGLHAETLEFLGAGLWWLGYSVLWLLLPVAAFRPENRFYTRGDCALRVKRFAQVLGLLVLMHLWLVAVIAFAFRGGWR